MSQQQEVVDAFLTALRAGDLRAVLAVLDPDVVRRADHVAVPSVMDREVRGAANVAREALTHADRLGSHGQLWSTDPWESWWLLAGV
jgi:RNA polymerase sigma-70 factor (ECF subfamily)